MSLSNLKGSLGGWGYPKSDGWSSNCSEDSDVVVEEVSSKQGNVCLYKHIISLQHLPASPGQDQEEAPLPTFSLLILQICRGNWLHDQI